MIWVILAALGVPLWLCAAVFLMMLFRNRALRRFSGSRRRHLRGAWTAMLALGLVAAGCGSSTSSSNSTAAAPLSNTTTTSSARSGGINRLFTARVPGIGAVLVGGKGRTVYVYLPEKGGKIKCVGGCASVWPPLLHTAGGRPEATSAVHPTLIGTIGNPAGAESIVTYAGWPLHTYSLDTGTGSYLGQGNDGQWYMISPAGTVITKPVSSSTGGNGY